MRNENLKRQILDKFKTIRRFTRLANLDYTDVCKALLSNDKTEIELIRYKFELTSNEYIPGFELTDKLREKIKDKVLSHPSAANENGKRTIQNFCDANGFHGVWISRVISKKNTRCMVKIDTPKMKRLFKILKIKS